MIFFVKGHDMPFVFCLMFVHNYIYNYIYALFYSLFNQFKFTLFDAHLFFLFWL